MEVLYIQDETAYGLVLHQFRIPWGDQYATVRDLITVRIQSEVSRYNRRLERYFRGLVQPSGARQAPLGYQLPARQRIDEEKQLQVALEAFQKRRLVLSIDGWRPQDLDEPVLTDAATAVRFIKLGPLVGG